MSTTRLGNTLIANRRNAKIHKPLKSHYTAILEFEVISPTNELESSGEVLELSIFGEYCPEASLRGYSLEELLGKPNNYRAKTIAQQGEVIQLK